MLLLKNTCSNLAATDGSFVGDAPYHHIQIILGDFFFY